MDAECPVCRQKVHTYQTSGPTGEYVQEGFNLRMVQAPSGPFYFAAHGSSNDHQESMGGGNG